MNALISSFKGISPIPVSKGTWIQVLESIKSDKYRKAIANVRELIKKYGAKSEEYKKQKCRLPAVSFGGTFSKGRKNLNIDAPTGFIIPDIDSIPQQVESLFSLLIQDTNVWFVFRSPSGEGLKVGIRAQNITDDTDHKKFYFAVEQYFKELYGVKIDMACKDISRLTFISHDPNLWINSEAQYFDVQKWSLALPPVPEQPTWIPGGKTAGKEKYARKVLEGCCQELLTCAKGDKHITRLKKSRLIGGYLQWLSEKEILSTFEQAITASGTPNISQAMKTVKDGIAYGKVLPIEIEDLNKSTRSSQEDIEYYYDEDNENEMNQRKVDVSSQNYGEHDEHDEDDEDMTNMTNIDEDMAKTWRSNDEDMANDENGEDDKNGYSGEDQLFSGENSLARVKSKERKELKSKERKELKSKERKELKSKERKELSLKQNPLTTKLNEKGHYVDPALRQGGRDVLVEIYKLTSPSGKAYIGQTKNGIGERVSSHARFGGCPLINAAMNKYGRKSFVVEILYKINENEAGAYEKRAIQEHNTIAPNGYNVASGSEKGKNIQGINLSRAILEWLLNSSGSFTVEQLDRELHLVSPTDRKNRSKILNRIINKKTKDPGICLKKDPRKNNLYHLSNTEMDWIDITASIEENFPLKLPFNLDQKISIPPKSIIMIAGSTNSGKTGLILETLRLNLQASYNRMLLVSEGIGEIRGRIRSFGDSLVLWKERVMIAALTSGFENAIENYNADGLTCIDYLEPAEGEFYRLPQQISNIYSCLNSGVAMVALQKHPDRNVGVGGHGTKDRSRLYVAVDYLCTCKRSIVCALSLIKVKQSLDESMEGKELHFRIEQGSVLTPLTDWMLSSRVNREKYARQYENEDAEKSFKKAEDDDFVFRTENGKNKIKMVRITRKQAEKWAENMPNINVFKRLERMVADSMNKLFLDKSYFYQIPTILNKANEEASQREIGNPG